MTFYETNNKEIHKENKMNKEEIRKGCGIEGDCEYWGWLGDICGKNGLCPLCEGKLEGYKLAEEEFEKCSVCGKQEVYSKECFDCYVIGCDKQLERQREAFIKDGDKIFLSQNYGDDSTNDEYDYALKGWEQLKEKIK